MPKDNVIRFCLIAIVVLLAFLAFQKNPPASVRAADAEQYLVTYPGGSVDQSRTRYLNDMHARGWKLLHGGSGTTEALVWYK
jgi:hypothetical protein